MTANLTVPADVWACQQPGVPLVAAIVEAEPGWGPVHRIPTPNGLGMDAQDLVVNPPAWLVALRDARCERCKGKGRLRQWQNEAGPGGGWATIPCDDGCHDGRLLHDVRVETGVICNRIGPNFGKSQTRTVRCLVDVAEIRSNEAGDACHDKDDHLDVISDGTVQTMFDGHDGELETAHVDALAAACGKPPADWVGGYAVILTTTNQEAE